MIHDPQNAFYDHMSRSKPTKPGLWLAKMYAKKIFDLAGIKTGSSVLEIGPGRGIFADICLGNGIEYWAIEPNEQMAEDLEKRGAKVIRQTVPPLYDFGRTFDFVVMISVMEHMDTMTMALTLTKQVYRILKPGGKFVICSPDYMNWKHHFFANDFTHNYITTMRRLESLLISGGFESITGIYLSGTFKGLLAFPVSFAASFLPFGKLNVMFPKNELCRKLYEVQTVFLRKVLIVGWKGTD